MRNPNYKIFVEDNFGTRKLSKNIIVDTDIDIYDHFELQGIIWHHGESYNNGHYTSNVKVNGVWYNTDDTSITITQSERFQTYHDKVPYIVVYKKRNTEIVFHRNEMSE